VKNDQHNQIQNITLRNRPMHFSKKVCYTVYNGVWEKAAPEAGEFWIIFVSKVTLQSKGYFLL